MVVISVLIGEPEARCFMYYRASLKLRDKKSKCYGSIGHNFMYIQFIILFIRK